MAQAAATSGWLRGRVKAVPSGDSLVIMGFAKAEIPPEKTIVLAHLTSPRLVILYLTSPCFKTCSNLQLISIWFSSCRPVEAALMIHSHGKAENSYESCV